MIDMIIRDAGKCYGCRTCELACSYHHAKIFSPAYSSIEVDSDMRSGTITWCISKTCDGCAGEPEALCVKYCAYKALKIRD